jgi:hypothetical protein
MYIKVAELDFIIFLGILSQLCASRRGQLLIYGSDAGRYAHQTVYEVAECRLGLDETSVIQGSHSKILRSEPCRSLGDQV